MIDPTDLGVIRDGARLAGFLPYLQDELIKMEEAAVVRIDQLMTQGKLTPELSQMAWIELLSYRRLRRRLEQRVRIGVSVGERNAPFMSEPPLPSV